MLLWKTVTIADNERVLLYRRECFDQVLKPGRYRLYRFRDYSKIETYDVTKVIFDNKNAKFLLNTYGEKLSAHIDKVELTDNQVGIVYRDGKFSHILAPGSLFVFWKNVEQVDVTIIDISEDYEVSKDLLNLLGRGVKATQNRETVYSISYNEIPDEHIGLLVVNGKLERILKPGSYGFWKFNRSIAIKLLDMRLQATEVNGQEILTKDRVSLRVNLSAVYRVINPEIAAVKLNDFSSFIYRELQLRLREAVGTKTLDQLLKDKDSLNTFIFEGVKEKFIEYGISLQSVGVKDVILPGDMKLILNQVVEAQKEAEANLIKRREETQAMRALHNTAKMMESNPTLLRLKELESLERVTTKIDKISVYGWTRRTVNQSGKTFSFISIIRPLKCGLYLG